MCDGGSSLPKFLKWLAGMIFLCFTYLFAVCFLNKRKQEDNWT